MKKLLLDTNVLLNTVRGNNLAHEVEKYVSNSREPLLLILVVSMAEAESLGVQWNWGIGKVQALRELIRKVITIDIEHSHEDLINAYCSIDTYSKRKSLDSKGRLLSGAARKMGKNDLWIAATAHVLDTTLLITDGDFDHLH